MTSRAAYQKQKKQERKSTHKRVELQFTNREYQLFARAAKKEGTSVNRVIKNMATAYRDTSYFVPAELKQSLDTHSKLIRNIADNINQMARNANIFYDVDANRVFQHLAELDTQVRQFVEQRSR